MKLKDLLTRRILGEPVPQRFTAVNGDVVIGIDKIEVNRHQAKIYAGDVLVAEFVIENGFDAEHDTLHVQLDGAYLKVTLS